MSDLVTTSKTFCSCGETLDIEMEFDIGLCVDCQSRNAIITGHPLRIAKKDKIIKRYFNFPLPVAR